MTLPLDHFPFRLGATDIVKHILNIDSRFRENPAHSTSSDFYLRLLTPVKNVLRIRITSIEMPNNYYIFSAVRRNITIIVISGATFQISTTIVIPGGNYAAYQMRDALNDAMVAKGIPWLKNEFDEISGTFTFTGTQQFQINTVVGDNASFDRLFDYGLGYNLGFSPGLFSSKLVGDKYILTSDTCATFAGDPYIFLKINEFNCVRQTNSGNDFYALAKIVVKEAKNYMTYDDYAGQHAKEVTFPTPQDLSRLHIQFLDMYGHNIDLCTSHISFSIEVLEIKKLSLYDMIRDAFTVGWQLPNTM